MIATIVMDVFIILLLVLLGAIFSLGKGSSLIAGFNTLPQEEKEKYDVVALSKFMGKMMFALSVSAILWLISHIFKMSWLFYVGLSLFVGFIVFILVYVNTGNRFKKTNTPK